MTTVTLKEEDGWYSVEAKGHATGSKEMCLAVSVLLQTLHAWLVASRIPHAASTGYGDSEYTWKGNRAAYDLITAGFLRLQGTDPDHISVRI